MKKLILSFIVLLMAANCFAQDHTLFVNGNDINEIGIDYIEVVAVNNNNFRGDWTVAIDIGMKYDPKKESIFKNEEGKILTFITPMQAINYLKKCGWELKATAGGPSAAAMLMFYTMKKNKAFGDN